MSNLRFNHFFAVLMVVAAFSAFVIPPRYTNPARVEFQGLFSPISRPARSLSGFIYRRFHHQTPVDLGLPTGVRPDESLLAENHQLRLALTSITQRFETLSEINADRGMVGNLRSLCNPATVSGADVSGLHESLILSGAFTAGFKADQPVIYPGGLVGKITLAGLGSAHVRLITDKGYSVSGRIGQLKPDADGQLHMEFVKTVHPVLQGRGNSELGIQNTIIMQQVKELGIAINDVISVDDGDDWPNVKGQWIGRISAINAQQNAPLFADIRVAPMNNLLQLREVMVMVKK